MKTRNVWNFHLSVGELFTSGKILMWLPSMGITWSFSCNIQQGLWKFLESRLGNVNRNDQWLHDSRELEGLRNTWSIKQLAPLQKNTKTTSKKYSFYTHYVWYKSRETLLNSGTRFHHMSNFQWQHPTGDAHLVSLGSLASRFQSPPRSCQ